MRALISLQNRLLAPLGTGDTILPLAARFAFAAALLVYFLNSGITKLGDGVLGFVQPSLGAYAQIFPKAMESAGYDVSQLGLLHWAIVVAGTWTEFLLPVLIVIGFMTRLASLGMIGFIVVQSLTDLIGHGAWNDPIVLGSWFDAAPDGIILDQRMFWVLALSILVFKGAGLLSVDRWLSKPATGVATPA